MLSTVVVVPSTTVKVSPIVTEDRVNFSDIPVRFLCLRRRKTVLTQVIFAVGLGTWVLALVFILRLFIPN